MKLRRMMASGMKVALLVLLAGQGVKAGVLVVDPGGGAGAALLKQALLDAKDGEIVLVRQGDYSLPGNERYVIQGKGLTLCNDAGVEIVLQSLLVDAVPADRTVVVRGFTVQPEPNEIFPQFPALEVTDCVGTIWAEGCTLLGDLGWCEEFFAGPIYLNGTAGLVVDSSAAVVLQSCTVTGGDGYFAHLSRSFSDLHETLGAPGVKVVGSNLLLDHCTVTGGSPGAGSSAMPYNGTPSGSPGVQVSGSFVHITGSTVQGGGNNSNVAVNDKSGDGLQVLTVDSLVKYRDSTFTPGAVIPVGTSGVPISAPAGTLVALSNPSRAFTVSSPLREGQLGSMAFQGEPNDLVLLLVSLQAGFVPMPSRQGVAVAGLNPLLFLVGLGQADGAGQLTIPFIAPAIPTGVDGLTIEIQAAAKGGAGATLEAASALVWLDASL
jgi:hypothetical protein